jgi:hypothetical protein
MDSFKLSFQRRNRFSPLEGNANIGKRCGNKLCHKHLYSDGIEEDCSTGKQFTWILIQNEFQFDMQPKFSFPYAKYLSNGEPVLGEQMNDGSTEALLMVGDLREMVGHLVEEPVRLRGEFEL